MNHKPITANNLKEELSKLTDEELLEKAKKLKSNKITHAFLIGFMVGIIIFSAATNSIGFFTLIPLFLIYKFTQNPHDYEQNLKALLKERNLE